LLLDRAEDRLDLRLVPGGVSGLAGSHGSHTVTTQNKVSVPCPGLRTSGTRGPH
jgi:hypothetical protein